MATKKVANYQGRAGTDIATVQVSKQKDRRPAYIIICVIVYFYQLSCCRKLCFHRSGALAI